jgi:hypothetical protein
MKWCIDENYDKFQPNNTDDSDNIVPAKVFKNEEKCIKSISLSDYI